MSLIKHLNLNFYESIITFLSLGDHFNGFWLFPSCLLDDARRKTIVSHSKQTLRLDSKTRHRMV